MPGSASPQPGPASSSTHSASGAGAVSASQQGDKQTLKISAFICAAGSIALALAGAVAFVSGVAAPAAPLFLALAVGAAVGGMMAWQGTKPAAFAPVHPGQYGMVSPGFYQQDAAFDVNPHDER